MRVFVAVGIGVVAGLTGPVAAPAQEQEPVGGTVLQELPCPVEEPMGMTLHDGQLWISDMTSRTIVEVDPATGAVLDRLPVPGFQPTGLAWNGDTLFAADRRMDLIERRHPGQPADDSPIPYYEKWAMGMAYDGEHLWVVDERAARLHEIDPDDGTTIHSFPAPAERPIGLTFDGSYLWLSDHKSHEIYMVERKTGRVEAILPAPGPYPSALAADADSLWVADYQTRKLYRIARPGAVPYFEDQPRKIHASFEVLYRAKGTGSITDLVAYLPLPRDIPGQHLQGELQFEPEPTRFETDQWDQKVAVFELGEVPAGELRTVRWTGDLTLYRIRFQLLPERVDRGHLPSGMRPYLADDKKYDLDSKTITELVDQLTADQKGYYERARAIYDHLTEVIKYDRSSGWNNAATVLERGTGSCSEYTFALVALLRRAGIPARYVGALSERDGEASYDDVFHRWAEAYMPGYGWVPVDANAGEGKPPGERGNYFGGRSNRHVVTTIGGGASKLLEWEYNAYQTYHSRGNAELEVRPISRFRPRDGAAAQPAVAEAPTATAPAAAPPQATGAAKSASPARGSTGSGASLNKPLVLVLGLLVIVLFVLLLRSRARSSRSES